VRYLALSVLLAACHHAAAASGGTPPAPRSSALGDTLRGTVAVVGSTPRTQLVLRPADGGRSVTLAGDSALLHSVAGLDVMVTGTSGPKSFAVSALLVRSAGGVAALDGIIAATDGAVSIVVAGGQPIALRATPPEFLARTGSRAWVTTAPDGTVLSFGWIATPPAGPR